MSVETQLGLHDEGNGLLAHAGQNWASWADRFPCLSGIGGVGSLRAWLRAAEPAAADEVLHALVTLASPSGGDDASAAAMVAWALLPGASVLAQRLRTLSPRIDEIVAAQLWIEIRTFPWQRLRKVAANILANTRTGVLRECGAHRQLSASIGHGAARACRPDGSLLDQGLHTRRCVAVGCPRASRGAGVGPRRERHLRLRPVPSAKPCRDR